MRHLEPMAPWRSRPAWEANAAGSLQAVQNRQSEIMAHSAVGEAQAQSWDTQPFPLMSFVILVGYQVNMYFILFMLNIQITWLGQHLSNL